MLKWCILTRKLECQFQNIGGEGLIKTFFYFSNSLEIDLLAILQKSLDRAIFLYILYARLDRVALELLTLLFTFENSTKCNEISFDPNSYSLKFSTFC